MIIEEGDIGGEMKRSARFNENTYGHEHDSGSNNTSRGAQLANRTKT